MPSSLRFVAWLLAAAALLAIGSLATLGFEDRQAKQTTAEALTGGRVDAGRKAFRTIGCGGCHRITGTPDADGMVGPTLDGFATRTEIAGVLSNTPDHLIRWLRQPQAVLPGNGMPDQHVGERDARDLAAFLYTQTKRQ